MLITKRAPAPAKRVCINTSDSSVPSVSSSLLASPSSEMTALQPLDFLTLPPLSAHTATVIFLHGLGDSGQGWSVSPSSPAPPSRVA